MHIGMCSRQNATAVTYHAADEEVWAYTVVPTVLQDVGEGPDTWGNQVSRLQLA